MSLPSAPPPSKPKHQRRKAARPSEILDAALDVFAGKGYAAANLNQVADRAGVAKGTLYLYYPTKADLFRAVAQTVIAPDLQHFETAAASPHANSLTEIVPLLLARLSSQVTDPRVPAIVKMVISESHTFPDLARIWHDQVVSKVLGILAALIARAQSNKEAIPGDPQLYAFSILGPLLMALLFRHVFHEFNQHLPDLHALAAQHSQLILRGLSPTLAVNTPTQKELLPHA